MFTPFLTPRSVGFLGVAVAALGCAQNNQTSPPLTDAVSIYTQPASVMVPMGATTTLTVFATGSAPINYQWSENGVAISGATNASYTTPPIETSDNGASYTVTVSNSVNSVTSSPAIITVGARAPEAGDLRFQLVDFWALSQLTSGGGPTDIVQYQTLSYPNAIGSQLEIGDGSCNPASSPVQCAWPFWVNDLTPGTTGLTLNYKSGSDTGFASDLAAINSPNTVLMCLDLQPAAGIYGMEWMQNSQGGFDLITHVVAPANIASVVAQDAQASRVITAVSFDTSGNANLMSYGWQGDTTTTYDTQVQIAAPQNIAATGTNLAAAGYILTAFGGDDVNGYVLIGTRVHGDTMARGFQVVSAGTSGKTIPLGLPVGRVAWDVSSSNQGNIFMLEN